MESQSVPDIRPDYQSPNYDPEKIAPYTLEDPLTFPDGRTAAELLDSLDS